MQQQRSSCWSVLFKMTNLLWPGYPVKLDTVPACTEHKVESITGLMDGNTFTPTCNLAFPGHLTWMSLNIKGNTLGHRNSQSTLLGHDRWTIIMQTALEGGFNNNNVYFKDLPLLDYVAYAIFLKSKWLHLPFSTASDGQQFYSSTLISIKFRFYSAEYSRETWYLMFKLINVIIFLWIYTLLRTHLNLMPATCSNKVGTRQQNGDQNHLWNIPQVNRSIGDRW